MTLQQVLEKLFIWIDLLLSSVGPDAASCLAVTAGWCIDSKPSVGTISLHFSEPSLLSATSDLSEEEGEGGVTHHHFAQVEPDVFVPAQQNYTLWLHIAL